MQDFLNADNTIEDYSKNVLTTTALLQKHYLRMQNLHNNPPK